MSASFYSRATSILLDAGFNSVNNLYFFLGLKQVKLEEFNERYYGYFAITSSSVNFQWKPDCCFYNNEKVNEEQLLEKFVEFAKE
jgi:hypothetical protein